MTCASCVARVEKKLNELDGVYGERQPCDRARTVAYDPEQVRLADLVRAVEAAGYTAALAVGHRAKTDLVRPLRNRLLVSLALDGSVAGVVDGVAAAVRWLGMARVRARDADRALGGLVRSIAPPC